MMSKCARCEKQETGWESPALRILHTERFVLDGSNRTKVSELVDGRYGVGLCPECEKAEIIKHDPVEDWLSKTLRILAILCVVGLLVMLIVTKGSPAIRGYFLGLVLAAIVFGVARINYRDHYLKKKIQKARMEEPLEKRCILLGTIEGANHPRYVPLADGLYPDREAFDRINSHLIKEMQDEVYEKYIAGGKWKGLSQHSAETVIGTEDALQRMSGMETQNELLNLKRR